MTNLKLVLRTYSALRQMSPDDIALLETLRGLNDGDRELMVETLQGKATAKKAGKKSSTSKSSQSSSRSPRASGIHAQLKERRQSATRDVIGESGEPDIFDAVAERRLQGCAWESSDGPCFRSVDDNVHHKQGDPDYHEFVEGKSTTPPTPAPSPANGAEGSTTQNSEASAASVGAVTGGSSE